MLAGKTKKVATIEEINEAAADGWAGLVEMDGREVKIAVDTNVLVRAAVRDDQEQTEAATRVMARAEIGRYCGVLPVRVCLGAARAFMALSRRI